MKYKVADYKEPDYYTPKTKLFFDIAADETIVKATYQVIANKSLNSDKLPDIELNGHNAMKLNAISIDGQILEQGRDFDIIDDGDYTLLKIVNNYGRKFELAQEVVIEPEKNLSYEGLYYSDGGLVTQNESQGFRRIAYSIDRPDNLSIFTTTITGDKKIFPVMLSNGNELVIDINCSEDKHIKKYFDPFPKPYYLFALCAGDYFDINLSYDTKPNAKLKKLELYAPPFETKESTTFALDVLYKMMRWNEEVYNLELDLDEYRIVGVTKFNSGAMENKGLNVFSSGDVFLNPKFSTDDNYKRVLTVVSHETAHNWAGNRVTVRDWSQLCLKEGLATHIEQQFSDDVLNSSVTRLQNIEFLRNRQFAEDASYRAHAVHPKEYDSIDNFYTLTIYEKGAELLQTLEELLGKDEFINGVKYYFNKYDSYKDIEQDYFEKGPTINDFINSIAEYTKTDLSQFMYWYDYAGTPELTISDNFDAENKTYELIFTQNSPTTHTQKEARPAFMMPINIALFTKDGEKSNLESDGIRLNNNKEAMFVLIEREQSVVFKNIEQKPVPSILRNFTAPVKIIKDPLTVDDNNILIEHDDDAFVKWDRMQHLLTQAIIGCYENALKAEDYTVNNDIHDLYAKVLSNHSIANDLKAKLLELPTYAYISQQVASLEPIVLYKVIKIFKQQLAARHYNNLAAIRDKLNSLDELDNNFNLENTQPVKDRMLFTLVQDLLCYSGNKEDVEFAFNTAKSKTNFTLVLSSYMSLLKSQEDNINIAEHEIIDNLYKLSENDNNLREKWLVLQASTASKDSIDNMQQLIDGTRPGFDLAHPHQCYSLIRTFISNNISFYEGQGRGYNLAIDAIYKLDTEIKNHSIASRIAASLLPQKNLADSYKQALKNKITELKAKANISDSLKEILSAV